VNSQTCRNNARERRRHPDPDGHLPLRHTSLAQSGLTEDGHERGEKDQGCKWSSRTRWAPSRDPVATGARLLLERR